MTVPRRAQPGVKLRLRERGVQRGDRRGDLYVKLAVQLPDRDDEEFAAALRRAESLYSKPVREELAS